MKLTNKTLKQLRTPRKGFTNETMNIICSRAGIKTKGWTKKCRGTVLTEDDLERIYRSNKVIRASKPRPSFKSESKCVYLIKSGDFYKIGKSRNLKSRACSLRGANPVELYLVGLLSLPNESLQSSCEMFFHQVFDKKRKSGEWFSLDEQDLKMFFNIAGKSTTARTLINNLTCKTKILMEARFTSQTPFLSSIANT